MQHLQLLFHLIFFGQSGSLDNFLNGAFNSSHKRFANLPTCKPQAINLDCVRPDAIAEPIVSMSPFLPVKTGTAPFEAAAEIQSASFANSSL